MNRTIGNRSDTPLYSEPTNYIAVCLYILYLLANFDQSLSPRLGPYEHEIFVMLIVVALFGNSSANLFRICSILFVISISLLIALFNDRLYPKWIMSDVISVVGPIIFYGTFRKIFKRNLYIPVLPTIVSLFTFSLISTQLYTDQWQRTEPPEFLLCCFLAVVASYRTRDFILFIVCNAAFVVVLIMCFQSQVRTYVIIIPMIYVIHALLERNVISLAIVIFSISISLLVLPQLDLTSISNRLFEISISNIYQNHFITARVAEIKDSLSDMGELGWIAYTFGMGPGATFTPNILLDVSPFILEQDFRITDEFDSHLIHFGPHAYFFRFGMFGVFWLLLYYGIIIFSLYHLLQHLKSYTILERTIIFSTFALLLNFMIRPVYVNIDFHILNGLLLFILRNKLRSGLR